MPRKKGLMEPQYSKANIYRAIRAKCLDCCCNQTVEITNCSAKGCPLRPYRFGAASARIIRRAYEQKEKQAADIVSK